MVVYKTPFCHTFPVKIIQFSNLDGESTEWIRENIQIHQPDIGVFCGNGHEEFLSIADQLEMDVLHTPGDRDDRGSFESRYGRRYRIDQTYRYIDRTVRFGGGVLILLDTSDRSVAPEQLLWLDSVLHDVNADVTRGIVSPIVPIFSFSSLVASESDDPSIPSQELVDMLTGYGRGPLELFIFTASAQEETQSIRGGVHHYSVPSGDTGVRYISIQRFGPLETVVAYKRAAVADGTIDD